MACRVPRTGASRHRLYMCSGGSAAMGLRVPRPGAGSSVADEVMRWAGEGGGPLCAVFALVIYIRTEQN